MLWLVLVLLQRVGDRHRLTPADESAAAQGEVGCFGDPRLPSFPPLVTTGDASPTMKGDEQLCR